MILPPRLLPAWSGVLVGTLAAGLAGQVDLYRIDGKQPADEYGWSVAGATDIDADGIPDYLVGAKAEDVNGPGSGTAYLVSGKTGDVIYELNGPENGNRLGYAVRGGDDLDGDLVEDLYIGAPRQVAGRGGVDVLSGATGELIRVYIGAAVGDGYGTSVDKAGDQDGDGTQDLLIGACQETTDLIGYVEVRSGAPNQQLLLFIDGASVIGASNGDRFGEAVANVGDVDGDGDVDYLIGAPGFDATGIKSGLALVVSSVDGELIKLLASAPPGAQFGHAVAALGDVDGDDLADYAVSSPFESSGRGKVRVFSGATGTVIRNFEGTEEGERFGNCIAPAGDLNGDGIQEIVIGAPTADSNGTDAGRVVLASVVTGQIMATLVGEDPGDFFGQSVAGQVDYTNDGIPDVLVGANQDPLTGEEPGFVKLVSYVSPWEDLGSPLAGVQGEPLLDVGGTLTPDTLVRLELYDAVPFGATVLVVGLTDWSVPFAGGLMVPSIDVALGGLPLDGEGAVDIDGFWPSGVPAGVEAYFQFWTPDPAGVQGFSASNAMLAVTPDANS